MDAISTEDVRIVSNFITSTVNCLAEEDRISAVKALLKHVRRLLDHLEDTLL